MGGGDLNMYVPSLIYIPEANQQEKVLAPSAPRQSRESLESRKVSQRREEEASSTPKGARGRTPTRRTSAYARRIDW